MVLLVGMIYIYINTLSGKQFITNRVQNYLAKKLKVNFTMGMVDYHLPNEITLSNMYLPTTNNDSLLYAKKLHVDIALFKLLKGEIEIKNVELENSVVHISRKENESNYNFQFVLDAFVAKPKEAKVISDTTDLKMNLNRLSLRNIVLYLDDEFAGSHMCAKIDSLELKMKLFKPDKLKFDITSLALNGMTFNSTMTKLNMNEIDSIQPKNYLNLNAQKLEIKNVDIQIRNNVTGLDYSNHISNLSVNDAKLSLQDQKLDIENLILNDSKFELLTTPSTNNSVAIDTNTTATWLVQIAKIDLENNQFKMNTGKQPADGFDINHLNITNLTTNIRELFYSKDSTHALIGHLKMKDHSGLSIDSLHANAIFSLHKMNATELYLKTPKSIIQNNLQLSFDDLKTLTQEPEKAIVNIELQNTLIDFDELFILLPKLKSNVSLTKMQHEKLQINSIINGTLQELQIKELKLFALNGSSLTANGKLINVLDTKKLAFDINILPSQILKQDIAKFVVFDKAAYSELPSIITLQGNATGNLNDMITNINLDGNQFLLNAHARLLQVNDIQKLHYDANIKAFNIQRELILAFIPKEKFPKNIELPKTILLSGTAKGDVNHIATNLKLDGSYGQILANGYINNFKQSNLATYDLNIGTDHFLIGKLLKQDSILGSLTMRTLIKGKGFDINSMETKVESEIDQIEFKKYNYQFVNINAALSKGDLKSVGTVNDPNLKLNYDLSANGVSKPNNLQLFLHLDTARLHELNLMKDTVSLASNLSVKSDNLSMEKLNLMLKVDSAIINRRDRIIILDSLMVNTYHDNENQILNIASPFLFLNAKGNFQYNKIAPSIVNFINRYYHISDPLPNLSTDQEISFDGKIIEHPIITSFAPKVLHFEPIVFGGQYNSSENDSALKFSIQTASIEYDHNKINTANLNIQSTPQEVNLLVSIDSLNTAQATLLNTQVKAILSNDSLNIDAFTKNTSGNDRYAFGAIVSVNNKAYTAHLKDRVILNNQTWAILPNNKIYYSPEGFYIRDFNLSTNKSILNIQSEQEVVKSPIDVEIKNFSITDITSVLNKDTLLASGIINGNFKVSEFEKALPAYEGDLKIDQLFVKQNKVGNLVVTSKKIDDITIHANLKLIENENDISIDGNYYLNHVDKQIDADIDINKFNIATLMGFTNNQITNAKGSINGKINITGKFAQPIWNGDINFNDPSFRLEKFGTAYKINNQSIKLNYPTIELNQFTITDSLSNTLVLDGTVKSKSISDYVLNVDIDSKDFVIVNTPRSTNEYIYGYAGINANLKVGGAISSPSIQGSVGLNDETDATLILPQQSENRDKALSVVRFIDRDTFALPETILFSPIDSSIKLKSAINYNVNVELSKKASLTIIIDPSTGDELKMNGEAKMNIGLDAGGNILLVGNYDLVKGHYILHYQFLKRQFDLLPQSTIMFSGNPMDAQLDIRAEYVANTSAIDLVGNELGDTDSKTRNTFNQKIPFKVLLFIKGTIKKLDISFDIRMPDENSGLNNTIVTTVENKLTQLRADPSSLNKQVFSLLVLNRFVGEQSSDFFKGNGGGIEDIARESVSKFLSAALDQIASDLVKGVDIDLNLNSYKDFSSGTEQQRTDLNVGITKRFMDDRLSISLGKDFGVEGDDKSGKTRGSTNASYLPNAIVNYKLSKDGKYAVRAYSKNKFEVILDGYVVESGLSFLVTMDYEKFNELFSKKSQIE
ncbi:MAG TPA: translocation/assembly module TamB domain-containing protein [Chitinophagaceae bacterium]|nr:translocation/assembly module TamB domain-containing protein [Chitinophagaceae bacterium]